MSSIAFVFEAGPSGVFAKKRRVTGLTPAQIQDILGEESEEEPYDASDDEEYIPDPVVVATEESDAEDDLIIEEEEVVSSESDDEEGHLSDSLTGKDGTQWVNTPLPQTQTLCRNIMRERGGAANFSRIFTAKETFRSFISSEMIDIILRETNRKGQRITDSFNNEILVKFPDPTKRPNKKKFNPFTPEEFDSFLGILIEAGVHKSNNEHTSELWRLDFSPLIRASMPRDRFKMLQRFIRFDNENTRADRVKSDKAAPIRDLWLMLNNNLRKGYKPYECITVDEQLFPYRGHTKFTQYIPSKPAKYGIKVFWACDASNAYPLKGEIYTGKPPDGVRQTNVGERVVLDLVAGYKGSGRNITTDNFFTSMELARALKSWNMTLVGTVRKNKAFLPPNMKPSKDRKIFSTNFGFNRDATVCSYVPKRNKSVILLSTMHMTNDVSDTVTAKPEIINYYNKTKGGVDTADKMLMAYTVKRRTNRWPLAMFYNMIDVAALASYVVYMEHNQHFKKTDRRRQFLKDLSREMCMPSVETRSISSHVIGNRFTRNAIELVLGRAVSPQPVAPRENIGTLSNSGPAAVVGRCFICSEGNRKDRKTRKSCFNCGKPVCAEHSVNKPTCSNCN